jgi:hypothetical protein
MDMKSFRVRDHRELGFGMGDAIALSNYVIVNENGFDDLEIGLIKLLKRLRDLDEH